MYYPAILTAALATLFIFNMHTVQAHAVISKSFVQEGYSKEVVQVKIVSELIDTNVLRYDVLLNDNVKDFNVYELLLNFKPKSQQVTAVVPSGEYCENRFLITKTIDQESGVVRLACGTVGHHSAQQPILASVYVDESKDSHQGLTLLEDSAIYLRDGKGTRLQLAVIS